MGISFLDVFGVSGKDLCSYPKGALVIPCSPKSILSCQQLWPLGLCIPLLNPKTFFPSPQEFGSNQQTDIFNSWISHLIWKVVTGSHVASTQLCLLRVRQPRATDLPSLSLGFLSFQMLLVLVWSGLLSPRDKMAGDTPGKCTLSWYPEYCSQIPTWLTDLGHLGVLITI